MIQPLFLLGNKRSGTSHLVRMLNLHPQVFVSHESDIAWILYQFHNRQPFCAHPSDSDRGMRYTLKSAAHLLRREASPAQNFFAIQTSLMEKGSPWLSAERKTDLRWMGDKKPMQHADPELLQFLLQHFPDAYFLHIVRHPFQVVASSDRFNESADGDFWLGLSPEEKLERWTLHERRVLQFRESLPGRVHSLRYEDLCHDTDKELSRIFEFLKVRPDPAAIEEADRRTLPTIRAVAHLQCSMETMRIGATYGYDLSRTANRLKAYVQNVYWRAVKKARIRRQHASSRF